MRAMLVHQDLAAQVTAAIQRAQADGDLPAFDIPPIVIERPRDASKGDYATAVALQLARPARMAPLKIAEAIAAHMADPDYLDTTDVAPPGFINFRLALDWLQQTPERILAEGDTFGQVDVGQGKMAQVECVSANPTGPITLGRSRGGVIGDTLARVLRNANYDVTLEYYYNDAGRQVTLLGESVRLRYLQLLGRDAEIGEEHYQGDYILDLARELFDAHGDSLVDEPVELLQRLRRGPHFRTAKGNPGQCQHLL